MFSIPSGDFPTRIMPWRLNAATIVSPVFRRFFDGAAARSGHRGSVGPLPPAPLAPPPPLAPPAPLAPSAPLGPPPSDGGPLARAARAARIARHSVTRSRRKPVH